jgi:hypothetical protein
MSENELFDTNLSESGCCDACVLKALQDDSLITTVCAENAHYKCFMEAMSRGFLYDSKAICIEATVSGSVDILKYAHARGWEFPLSLAQHATKNGRLELLKLFRSKQYHFEETFTDCFVWAVLLGNIEIVRFFLEVANTHHYLVPNTLIEAISNEHDTITTMLVDGGMLLTMDCLIRAVEIGRLDMFVSLLAKAQEQGLIVDDDDYKWLAMTAAVHDHPLVMEWFVKTKRHLLCDDSLYMHCLTTMPSYSTFVVLFDGGVPLTRNIVHRMCVLPDSSEKMKILKLVPISLFDAECANMAATFKCLVTLKHLLDCGCTYDERIINLTPNIMNMYISQKEKQETVLDIIINNRVCKIESFVRCHPYVIQCFRRKRPELLTMLRAKHMRALPGELVKQVAIHAGLILRD